MAQASSIEWTEVTWNPVTGCDQVSPGCAHCYAKTFAERWRGIPGHHYEQGFDLRLWPERIRQPLSWKRPKVVFVNSMSDLFHEEIPKDFISEVFGTMAATPMHTYQVLTKRPERLLEIANQLEWAPNIWMGVSVENRRFAYRADLLRRSPASIKFVSAEPLLGQIDDFDLREIDWLIAGGESGPGHRPVKATWLRSLRDQCVEQDVAFFFKQWGGHRPKAGGRLLDGRTWDEMPSIGERAMPLVA